MTQSARTAKPPRAASPELQRVAIYVRKSTTDGLDSDFSSLDAQREACELFARSQAARGWHILPTEYSDGGRTGANTDRPGLQKLLADLERGEIDVVLTFKLDRLSRSLLDFIGLMERFQARGVSFCCVSQNFDTSTPTGRLVLHVLASFSQFERELTAERTKNKIRGSKLRGKWCGGSVPMGYDLDAGRLAVNAAEAEVVRLVFDEYLATRSLSRVALRLNTLGHRQKLRGERGGRSWDKYSVQRILRNPIYVGLVRDGDDLHAGEHPALVAREIFEEANASLESRTTGHGPRTSRKSEFPLTGLLSCGPCGRAMTSSTGRGRNGTRYRFYRCTAHNEGHKCPSGFVSAPTIETLVLEELRRVALGGDLRRLIEEDVKSKSGLRRDLEEQRVAHAERVARLRADARRLLDQFRGVEAGGKLVTARLGELEREVEEAEVKIAEVEGQLRALSFAAREGAWLTELLERFDPVWQALLPPERRELLFLLVERATVSEGEVQLVLRGTAG